MAIRTVVTRGFGNGTFNGTIALASLRGYQSRTVTAGDPDDFLYFSRRPVIAKNDRMNANLKR